MSKVKTEKKEKDAIIKSAHDMKKGSIKAGIMIDRGNYYSLITDSADPEFRIFTSSRMPGDMYTDAGNADIRDFVQCEMKKTARALDGGYAQLSFVLPDPVTCMSVFKNTENRSAGNIKEFLTLKAKEKMALTENKPAFSSRTFTTGTVSFCAAAKVNASIEDCVYSSGMSPYAIAPAVCFVNDAFRGAPENKNYGLLLVEDDFWTILIAGADTLPVYMLSRWTDRSLPEKKRAESAASEIERKLRAFQSASKEFVLDNIFAVGVSGKRDAFAKALSLRFSCGCKSIEIAGKNRKKKQKAVVPAALEAAVQR